MIQGFDIAGTCTVNQIIDFAAANGLIITPVEEFNKTVFVIGVIGAVIGICAWELFKFMYAYGKRHQQYKD